MGDRGNIAIKSADARIYLYSHWGGSELPNDLKTALAKRWRWDDDAYLARIIFDAMLAGRHDEETGFGIANYISDNDSVHPILVVDCHTQTVTAESETGTELASWSFEEYIALDDPEQIVGSLDYR